MFCSSSSFVLPVAVAVPSSAYMIRLQLFNMEGKSLIKMENSKHPRLDPCGTDAVSC